MFVCLFVAVLFVCLLLVLCCFVCLNIKAKSPNQLLLRKKKDTRKVAKKDPLSEPISHRSGALKDRRDPEKRRRRRAWRERERERESGRQTDRQTETERRRKAKSPKERKKSSPFFRAGALSDDSLFVVEDVDQYLVL